MKSNKSVLTISAVFICWLFAGTASAAKLNDADALKGLHEAKAVFLIDVNNPGKVAHIFKTIAETDKSMREQHVTPHIKVVVIGPAVAFLTKDRRGIGYMDERAVAAIQGEAHKLAEMGIRTEACGVAMKGMDVKPDDLIPDVHAVGNGFIEAIGYQAQGYELVPVY